MASDGFARGGVRAWAGDFHAAFGSPACGHRSRCRLFGAAPVEAREVVAFRDDVSAGTIVVRTGERRLYYVMGDGRAIRYPVGVGKASKQWTGTTRIDGKYVKPGLVAAERGQARQALAA